jgi:hypothetical protein
MAYFEIPIREFDQKIKVGGKINELIEEIAQNITEFEIKGDKDKDYSTGFIVGTKGQNIIIRMNNSLTPGKKYEIRTLFQRGLIAFKSKILEKIDDTKPYIFVIEKPEHIFLCERRRFHRLKVDSKSEVLIKRATGYAFFCSLVDLSLGGFSALMQIKDRMIEYFLPLIEEEIDFRLNIEHKGGKYSLEGKAKLKHYSLDSHGKYKAGFEFTKINKKEISRIIKLLERKLKTR